MAVVKSPMKQPRSVPSKKGVAHRARSSALRKHPQAVDTDSGWCCIARPRAISPPPASARRTLLHLSCGGEDHRAARLNEEVSKEKDGRGKERRKGRRASEDVLKPGELAALIKQGFIGSVAVEKGGGAGSPFRLRLSPGKVSPLVEQTAGSAITVSSHVKLLGSVQNVGIASPPSQVNAKSSPTATEKTRSSSTLQDMMVQEHQIQPKPSSQSLPPSSQAILPISNLQLQQSSQQKVNVMLIDTVSGSQFNDSSSSDVRVTLSSKGGGRVTVNVHKHVLCAQSKYFAARLSERASIQRVSQHVIDISDCEDVEVYLQTLRLMYLKDMKRALMKETVSRVLGILKVSASIVFDAGVLSCLEYLEAVPWAEDEEEQITTLVAQLQLDGCGATEVLTRLSTTDMNCTQDILMGLLDSVTKGTDDKARREMKGLISRMLRENAAKKDYMDDSKETLYSACASSIDLLKQLFKQIINIDVGKTGSSEDKGSMAAQISRQADNLHWLGEIMIDQQIANDFVRMWANQRELAALHKQVPVIYRYEISRVTARLCIGIGKGQVLSPKDVRFSLLQTWFQPLLDDFGWLHRCCKGLDKKLVEEGISQTILTLPLKQQQIILLGWFDRFSSHGDDCPNLQKGFEVWWRRTFLRPLDSPKLITLST
ncbi:hypothetical protein O6H91_12G059500 [Diphasiastrum complanatum]|uniref:Uncharacterized protein n=1 Tax=Diphasiastrum complanatum TaxID=34168 RepID=A0ACC2C2M0_DIPCM|nr:hypothetical protein O6H91_Y168800 [Diphasiastrum complanatum]KAJ7536195.1 hypothetical protein O6H91_12G059500 [Diphasiastrum complanatum]